MKNLADKGRDSRDDDEYKESYAPKQVVRPGHTIKPESARHRNNKYRQIKAGTDTGNVVIGREGILRRCGFLIGHPFYSVAKREGCQDGLSRVTCLCRTSAH